DPRRVEPGERLVEQQRPGSVQQAAGDYQLLLHAAGQLPRERLGLFGELELLEQGRDAPLHVRHLVEAGGETEMLFDSEVVEQVRLVRHECEQPLGGHRLPLHVVPADPDRSELALQLTDAIAAARAAVQHAGNRAFRAYGLSHRAHAALNAVDASGADGARPKEVAAALGVSRAAATTFIQRLEAKGLVET